MGFIAFLLRCVCSARSSAESLRPRILHRFRAPGLPRNVRFEIPLESPSEGFPSIAAVPGLVTVRNERMPPGDTSAGSEPLDRGPPTSSPWTSPPELPPWLALGFHSGRSIQSFSFPTFERPTEAGTPWAVPSRRCLPASCLDACLPSMTSSSEEPSLWVRPACFGALHLRARPQGLHPRWNPLRSHLLPAGIARSFHGLSASSSTVPPGE